MKSVVLQIGPPDLSEDAKRALLDKEVDDFSYWMTNLSDWKYKGPLNKAERVLLLTYLIQKTKGALDKES